MASSSSSGSSSESTSKTKLSKAKKSANTNPVKNPTTSSSSDSDDSSSDSSSSSSASSSMAVDVGLSNLTTNKKQKTKDASKKEKEPPVKTTLKDLFAPRGEDAKFSLLGHLNLDLDLDLELDFAEPEEQNAYEEPYVTPDESELLAHTSIPVRTNVLPFSQIPPDPKQPLFFPHPTSFPFANSTYVPHNKARDMFDVSRDKGWDPKLGVFVNVNTGDEEYNTSRNVNSKDKKKNGPPVNNPGWAMRTGKTPLQSNSGSAYPILEGDQDNANAVPLSLPLPPPGFHRTATAEGVRARWEAEKGARTQDWKRRCREAGKVGRRRGGGVDNE